MSDKISNRVEEAKSKLIANCENALINKLTHMYGTPKLVSTTAKLEQVQGETTSTIKFSGSIKIKADVIDDNLKNVEFDIPVDQDLFEIEDDFVTENVDSAEGVDPVESIPVSVVNAFPLQADLSLFRLVDDGSDYYKVFHPSLDSGKEIGVISKKEYPTLNSKEAVLKDILANQILRSEASNHYDLSFTGSFVEPSIEKIAVEQPSIVADEPLTVEARSYKGWDIMTDPNQLAMTRFKATNPKFPGEIAEGNSMAGIRSIIDEIEAGTFSTIKTEEIPDVAPEPEQIPEEIVAHIDNGFRRAQSSDATKVAAKKEALYSKIVNELVAHLNTLQYGSVKVITASETFDDSLTGEVVVTAELLADSPRIASIPVRVDNSSYKLPTKAVVASLIAKSRDLRAEIEATIAQEEVEALARIDEKENFYEKEADNIIHDRVTKTAAASEGGGALGYGPNEVMRVQKHFLGLPDDFKEGDTVYADGCHWQLVSKADQKLSAGEDDGSLWTFHRVAPDGKKPKHTLRANQDEQSLDK